jgi:hypothetical protein
MEVTIRPERAGLGSYDSAEYAVLPGDNFRMAVKKRAMARVNFLFFFDSLSLVGFSEFREELDKKDD